MDLIWMFWECTIVKQQYCQPLLIEKILYFAVSNTVPTQLNVVTDFKCLLLIKHLGQWVWPFLSGCLIPKTPKEIITTFYGCWALFG